MRDPVLYRSMVQGHPEPLMISKYSGTIASTSSPVEALSSCNRLEIKICQLHMNDRLETAHILLVHVIY